MINDTGQIGFDFNQEQQKRVVVFDLETQLSASEVGGWGNTHLMRVAVGVAHDSADGEYKVFYEDDMPELLKLLKSADVVVGFNSRSFDYGVLKRYTDEPLKDILPTLDLIEKVQKSIGFRVGLNNIASATVGAEKSADGLQSLKWFKEGKLGLIADYCKQDVKVTRDVYLFALTNGHLFYTDKKGKRIKFPVKLD